jgi:hypothetical protein
VAEQELTPERLAEELAKLRVRDLLVSSFSTFAQAAYAKLDPSLRDLVEARLAIESMRALLPLLEEAAPPEALCDLRQVVTNLQLAYADAARPEGDTEPATPAGD